MQNARIRQNKSQLFIYDHFNVKPYYPSQMPAIRNPFARIFNQLVKALNGEECLPKIIVMLPEKVLIEYINFFGFGISSILDSTIGWLVTQCNRIINTRFQKLAEFQLGCVCEGEPRLIWIKIINSPANDKALAIRN